MGVGVGEGYNVRYDSPWRTFTPVQLATGIYHQVTPLRERVWCGGGQSGFV